MFSGKSRSLKERSGAICLDRSWMGANCAAERIGGSDYPAPSRPCGVAPPVHARAGAMANHYFQGDADDRQPGRPAPADVPGEDAASSESPPLVLIVDDFEDSRTMYSAYAKVCGFEVAEAADGMSALEKAKALLPQCIVIDLALPELDGWEVVRRLRADPNTRGIAVIAVSGHTLESHTRAALEAGCDDFLAKPCLPDVLVERIRKVLKAKSASVSRNGHA